MFFKEEHQLQTPSSFVTVPPPRLPFSPPSRRLHFFIRAANVFPPNSSLSRVMSRRCTAAGADSRLPDCRLPPLRWRCGATFSTLQLSGKSSACDKHCDTIVATMTKSRLLCETDKQTPHRDAAYILPRSQQSYLNDIKELILRRQTRLWWESCCRGQWRQPAGACCPAFRC